MTIYPLIRTLLFRLPPETAHKITLNLMRMVGAIQPLNSIIRSIYTVPDHPVKAFGVNFRNPFGLAAGYDKDGLAWRGLACLGFGHLEIGTVTPKPQPGNPKPRLFRLPEERALINRLGFPGMGSYFVVKHISGSRPKELVLGVNIGKNRDTPMEEAIVDYISLLRVFTDHADYMTVNVSSPNTVGLRQLQERLPLDRLLNQLYLEREQIYQNSARKIPLLVKLSPDLTNSQLDDALDVIQANYMDGVIASNTTVSRGGLKSRQASEEGGLSGAPLYEKSLTMVRKIVQRTDGKLPVIGVGGIFNATGVQRMLDAGAVLVQIYTSLVYEGPGLIKRILLELNASSKAV